MVSLLSSLNMTANTLSVNEKAISVVSHNVANMNTEGYHKQRVNLQTRNIAGAIGNNVNNQIKANGGVKIANVMRYNDEYLNNYYRTQLSEYSKLGQQLEGLGDLASILNDLEGTGIDGALSDFYKALNNLNEYPASSTARINFIETAKTLTSTMNSKYQQLQENTTKALGDGVSQESLENSKIYVQYRELNNKLEELASVNKALITTQTGTLEANNLLDKRDLILNEIAEFTDIKVVEKHNGAVNLYIGDTAVVKCAEVTGKLEIQTAKSYCDSQNPPIAYPDDWDGENAVISIVNPETGEVINKNANADITSGALGGLLHFATDNGDGENGINAGTVMKGLDKLAQSIADIFNDLNTRNGAYCINPDDTTKLQATTADNLIFVGADGTGQGITAGNIQINSDLLTDDGCWKIACAYFGDPATNFDENAIGNAQNVVDMLGTRTQKIADLDGMSLEDFYTGLVGKVASAGSNIQSLYDTQSEVINSIESKIKDATGVDLNEELVDLVKYQTAYSAAAQVFNTCNSCLDVLMSLGG
ncbi:TPA: flagellar hook-associated protein FlgK [Candidatus Gastranaerophilales bacterium HUM_13]|nr:MAG TPA: flagellar hook-associated protein FlgK [Candidatus Gastranaerophilales bacterium HUM_13]